ncbi:hypothetical protein Tco_1498202, partial [Tanacetum coccineum]
IKSAKNGAKFFGTSVVVCSSSTDPNWVGNFGDYLDSGFNGNKARELDALLSLVEDHLGTHVVTYGGCQSAHAPAVGMLRISLEAIKGVFGCAFHMYYVAYIP